MEPDECREKFIKAIEGMSDEEITAVRDLIDSLLRLEKARYIRSGVFDRDGEYNLILN